MNSESKDRYTLSVLIPTKNGADTLAELLAMLSLQTARIDEVLVADSGSSDNSVMVAEEYGAEVIHIPPESFDHGGTRSLLCKKAKGELLVFFTQDALPKWKESVERLIQPFFQDPNIVTCYGRQLPAFNAEHFAASLRRFNYQDVEMVRSLSDKDTYGLKTVFTSNSFACYRKSSLEVIDFFQDDLIFGEDTIAVSRLLLNGGSIAYVPEAEVYHSHNHSLAEDFRRYFDIGVLHETEKWFIETFGSAEGQGKKYIRHELRTLKEQKKWNLFPELVLRIFLKYCGYKLGRHFRRIPQNVIPELSLHRAWWKRQGFEIKE